MKALSISISAGSSSVTGIFIWKIPPFVLFFFESVTINSVNSIRSSSPGRISNSPVPFVLTLAREVSPCLIMNSTL